MLRKLSTRQMEVQLEAVEAELAALIGEPLRMTAFHGAPPHASTQAAEELQNGQPIPIMPRAA